MELYDVVAVNIDTREVVSIYKVSVSLRTAEAVVTMAVMRRGIEKEFYTEVKTGSYKVGDKFD